MLVYVQRTGDLYRDGKKLTTGYSGIGEGKNNPEMEAVHNVGPIPQGIYSIGQPEDTESHGPYVLRLLPIEGTDTFGRSGFLWHGDSIQHPGGASHGCICSARIAREQASQDTDHRIYVVAETEEVSDVWQSIDQ